MSAAENRGRRIAELESCAARALNLAASDPAQSIALSLATLVGGNAEDLRDDYAADRAREEAFAEHLDNVVAMTTIPPRVRNGRLALAIRYLREGYDNPPDVEAWGDHGLLLGAFYQRNPRP